jgi:hypothetical protein
VYWVFTVAVDQMDKFKPLVKKLALQFECNVGGDPKTVDFFERYTDEGGPVPPKGKLRAILERVLRFGQAHSR